MCNELSYMPDDIRRYTMAVKTKKDSQEAYFLVQLQPKLEKANVNMSENLVMEIDKPYFAVRLYKDVLQIDLKGSFKNEIEEALENKPFLRITIGSLLGIFVPLHIRLSHIDSARIVNEGKVKLILPYRRDVLIPLAPKEAKRLVDNLNALIPVEKGKELERIIREHELQKMVEERGRVERAAYKSPLLAPKLREELAKEEEREEQERED
jgi:hypothetical protein